MGNGDAAGAAERHKQEIGARVRAMRRVRGLTQTAAAARATISPGTWSRIERGEGQSPRVNTLVQVAAALHIPLWRLFKDPAAAAGRGMPDESADPRERLLARLGRLDVVHQQALIDILDRICV